MAENDDERQMVEYAGRERDYRDKAKSRFTRYVLGDRAAKDYGDYADDAHGSMQRAAERGMKRRRASKRR